MKIVKRLLATAMLFFIAVSLIPDDALAQSSDSVNVTFWVNTATVPDTMKSTSFVQLRGDNAFLGPWGPTSKAILTHVAGDYWKGTFKFKKGDSFPYKIFTNANSALTTENEGAGWENNLQPTNDRLLTVGNSDTTLPVQFVNGTPNNQDQYWRPWTASDSIDVYFRVNMASNESFNKNTQFMGVRGGAAPLDWGKSIVLTRESPHGNGGSRQYDATNLWSASARFPASAFASIIEYKYVILDANSSTAGVVAWEDGIRAAPDVGAGGNRIIPVNAAQGDTTIAWKWWANLPFAPFQGSDTLVITFRANMTRALSERGFAHGDTVQVRTGYGGTAKEVRTKRLTRFGLTSIYEAVDTVIAAVGRSLNYQYYVVKNANDVREIFYDFQYTGDDVAQAERRQVDVTTRTFTITDTTTVNTDRRRSPRFRNTTRLSRSVTVTYTLDLRPAFAQVSRGDTLIDIQGTQHVHRNTDIRTLGAAINGPAVGGWASWGATLVASTDTSHRLFDDGTNGDVVAGDTVFSRRVNYTTADNVGQEFKFGIGGADNEGGRGGFGNNHIENVDDSGPTSTIASQWGSINPVYYNAWDFDGRKENPLTGVEDGYGIPLAFALSQNYPNPFNPSTTIRFTIPEEGLVTLKIFNMLGQEVMAVLNQKMTSGNHVVIFDASRLTTGVYFYQLNSGRHIVTKKMTLLK